MILIERPCCETPLAIELPIPESLRCEDCAIEWTIADAAPMETRLAA